MAGLLASKDDGDLPIDAVKVRPCLMCRKDFLSKGRVHRRCDKCEQRLAHLTLSKVESNGGRSSRNSSKAGKLAEENITNTH